MFCLVLPSAASHLLLPVADCRIYVFRRNAYEEFRTPFIICRPSSTRRFTFDMGGALNDAALAGSSRSIGPVHGWRDNYRYIRQILSGSF
ncbi:hypothetical protein EDD17DRAFT_805814 [Pisolithus thermaeus]|nr:hypothetical protein EDD17DRAFT_805814 [Pisolithus thermaeus]